MRRRGIAVDGVFDGLSMGIYRVKYKIIGNPKISIIIPTRDKVDILKRCIDSILDKTDYSNYEIVLVDNGSEDDETLKYYKSLRGRPGLKILDYNKPFNYSSINNYAVSQVDSEYILFLNNDVVVINPEWLASMMEHAQRKDIGAVGAKLLYPNNTVQHAGVITGIIGNPPVAGHSHRHFPASSPGYFRMLQLVQDRSAVTGACMLTKKSIFEEIGGLDEVNLAIAFNDIDYCMKLVSP